MNISVFCSRKRSNALNFTLIELLVVIAIIAILAAILLPALALAKYTVREITCVNQIRQMGIGIVNYASNNDNWYPASTAGRGLPSLIGKDSDGWNWQPVFREYFGTDDLNSIMHCPLGKDAWDAYTAETGKPRNNFNLNDVKGPRTGYAFYFDRPSNDLWALAAGTPGMLRAGDSFHLGKHPDPSFRLLLSDHVAHKGSSVQSSHQPRQGGGIPLEMTWVSYGVGYRFYGASKTGAAFATDDLSVKIIPYVGNNARSDGRLLQFRNHPTSWSAMVPAEFGE